MLHRSVSLPTTSSWPPPPRGSRPPSWRDSPGEQATSQGPQPLLTIQLENLTSERFAILAIIGFFQRGSAKAAESATAVNFPFPAEKKFFPGTASSAAYQLADPSLAQQESRDQVGFHRKTFFSTTSLETKRSEELPAERGSLCTETSLK